MQSVDGEEAGGPNDDAFEGLSLDDDFVNSAPIHEESADQRVDRLRDIDAAHKELRTRREAELHAAQWEAKKSRRRRAMKHGKSHTPRPPGQKRDVPWRAVVVLVALAITVAVYSVRNGSAPTSSPLTGSQHEDAFSYEGVVTDFPAPPSDQQNQPINRPVTPAVRSDSYRFSSTQSGSDEPVAYDPCRPIHVIVNARTAPPNGGILLQDAFDDIGRATGLTFVMEGTTTEAPTDQRQPTQPDVYGDRWAPVLVAWSEPGETPAIAGDVAGVAGSLGLSKDSDQSVYVTGTVVLDGPQIGLALDEPGGYAIARTIIEHELGHVVGLAHVSDPTQVMNPVTTGTTVAFGAGDLTGLSLLGQGACFPKV